MSAADDIARVRETRPFVVDLARLLSLAAHIDVALVRALRTRVLAESDVSTEADLWSSILVESRSEGELVLRSDVREALWDELRNERGQLRAHWGSLSEVRTAVPPLQELEERLTFFALDRDLAAIDRELRTVIAAMRDEPDRRRNLAAWSAHALDHLPAEVRETEAARILGNVARSWVATPLQVATMTPDVDSMEIVQALQPTGTRVSIYLRRVGNTLEVATESTLRSAARGPTTAPVLSDWTEIPDVPANNPVLIVDHDKPWPLDLRSITPIPVRGARVMIGTLDKRRWWLEPEQPLPSTESIRTTSDDDNGGSHTVYLVAPDQVVTTARWLSNNPRPIVSFGGWRPSKILAIDDDADIALLRLGHVVHEPPLEFDPDVRQGQTWQAFHFGTRIVGTVATAWPGVTIRLPPQGTTPLLPGTPIFSGTRVICHVGSDPMRNGILHTVSARLIQWWLRRVTQAQAPSGEHPPGGEGRRSRSSERNVAQSDSPVLENSPVLETFSAGAFDPSAFSTDVFGPDADAETVTAPNEPRVWVQSKPSASVPREMIFQGAASVSKDDLVVMFVGEGQQRRPGAVYRVAGGRRVAQQAARYTAEPTSTEIRGERVVDLPPPPDDLLRVNRREIASYADVTSQRDTRNLGIHDGLIALLWRLQNFEEGRPGARVNRERAEARDVLRQLFGPPPSTPITPAIALATLPVVIELPARISTGGLLGATLADDGDVRRFRRHQWGDHEVTILTGSQPTPPPTSSTIRVKITDFEFDPRSAMMEFGARLFRNPGKDPFYDACGAPPPPFSTEVIRGPRRGGTPGTYDLELMVNRIPGVAPAHAYRRGIQFVIAVLDAMEHPGEQRWIDVLHIPGSGALDLVDAQHRVRAAGITDVVISGIDAETDLVERRYSSTANPSYSALAAALGGEVAAVYGGPPAVSDLLTHRFGVARERSGRGLAVGPGDLARVSVQATDDSPVRGYVAFYATTAGGRIEMVRSRADAGVAACVFARRDSGYSIGAVIEDEGVILEGFVDAKPAAESPTATSSENLSPAASENQSAAENQSASENLSPAASENPTQTTSASPPASENQAATDRDRDRDRDREPANMGANADVATQPIPPRTKDDNLVFLSYASRDRDVVRAIANELTAAGVNVFYDEQDVEPGRDWDSVIRDKLAESALFVPFISRATQVQGRATFWSEWTLAENRERMFPPGSRFVLPVALDPIDPRTAKVPERFRELQWYSLHERRPTEAFVAYILEQYGAKRRAREATETTPAKPVNDGAVFLSYSSRDRDVVRAIADALRVAAVDVFYDAQDIEPGEAWERVTRDSLARSSLLVAFISRATEEARQGLFWPEWRLAVEISNRQAPGSTFILPVALDPIDPSTATVPDSFRALPWYRLYERKPTLGFIGFIVEQYRATQRRTLP